MMRVQYFSSTAIVSLMAALTMLAANNEANAIKMKTSLSQSCFADVGDTTPWCSDDNNFAQIDCEHSAFHNLQVMGDVLGAMSSKFSGGCGGGCRSCIEQDKIIKTIDANIIKHKDVVLIYGKELDGDTKRAKELLTEKGIPFKLIEIGTSMASHHALSKKLASQNPVPAVWIKGSYIGGWAQL